MIEIMLRVELSRLVLCSIKRGEVILRKMKLRKPLYQTDLQLKVLRDQCINVHTIPQARVATGSLETGRNIKQLLATFEQFQLNQLRAWANATGFLCRLIGARTICVLDMDFSVSLAYS